MDNIGGVLVYGENLTQKSKYYVNLSGGGELIRHETFDIEVDFFIRAGNQRNTIRIVPTATIWSKFQVGLGHGIQDDVTPFIGYLFQFGKEKSQSINLSYGSSFSICQICTINSPNHFINLAYSLN